MKITKLNTVILVLLIGKIAAIQAAEIDLTIVGQGLVKTSAQTCTSSCKIATDQQAQILDAEAETGWYFSGWQGQKCDGGNEVIIQSKITDIKQIGGARGGTKTLETLDFNNDGLDDLIGISLFEGQIIAYENLGDGTFASQTIISDLLYPSALDSFDWNNDGYKDLFVSDFGYSNGGIRMYLNDGNGGFSYQKTFKFENSRPYSFSVLDYDLDGLPDFVISSFNADISGDLFVLVNSITNEKLTWFKNTGSALIEQKIIAKKAAITLDTFQVTQGVSPLILTAEIIAGEIVIYSDDKGSTRKVVATGGASYGAAFGDIDENGDIDILAAHYKPAELSLIYGQGNGEYSKAKILSQPVEGLTATAFGDFNNDSFIDVATGAFNKRNYYYFSTTSFDQCIVNKSASLKLSAVFKEGESVPDLSSEKGSGGSAVWLLFILSALICVQNILKVNQRLEP